MRYYLLLLLLCLCTGTGCQIIDQSRVQDSSVDTIPWNTRAPWEDTVIGVPY
jgi:hypothetical protein